MRRLTLALLTLTLAAGAAIAAPGYYYEALTTNPSDKKGTDSTTQVRAWITGGSARIEFVDSPKKGLFAEGSYLVTTDGGKTIKLVDPEEETWSEIDVEAMMNFAMTMMESMSGVVNMEFSDVHSEKLLDEPGERMLGRATTHQRWKSGHTMKVSVMGFKQETRMETLQDIWFTDELDAEGFRVWLRPDRFRTGNKDLDELMKSEFAKMQGFPLKTVAVTTNETKKGERSTVTAETRVTGLRDENVGPERFVVPEHYTNKPMLPTATDMPVAEQGEQEEAAPAEQDEDGAGIKKKLTGLFKKK